ncbi:MAG TPA: hypothetical protein VNL14_05645 [Candidatus Acidoferrales bacterium]|nr:hypothetical protein [Candidatus Acidoferrales bacterium]
MDAITYRGYQFELETKKTDSGRWISTAVLKMGERIFITVKPYAHDGYTSRGEAEQKTIGQVKDWIDRLR